jgi:hypothetical protein
LAQFLVALDNIGGRSVYCRQGGYPSPQRIRRANRREIEVELSGTLTKKGVNGQIISQSEAKAIETQAEWVNQHVQQMFSKYRPTLRSPAFWRLLVQSDPEKARVARATASFICRVVLAEVLGSRSAGMRLEFSEDPVRLSDVLGAIERAVGGSSSWELMQKKAGYA